MSQYLLLRDNKQSGPYAFDELTAKGLKAYDLIWIEGKSAAWRYPSEIQELKPFAPVVEEQPYDRFYKRQDNSKKQQQATATVASAVTGSNIQSTSSQLTTNIPVNHTDSVPKKTPATIANRRVVVILPNGMKENPADRVMFHQTVENKIQQPEKPVTVAESRPPIQETKKTIARELHPDKSVPLNQEGSYESELVEFKRESNTYNSKYKINSRRSSSMAARILAGTFVFLIVGAALGWAFNAGLLSEKQELIPVALPRETVQLPEAQTVYNNESAQAMDNQVSTAENQIDEQALNAAANSLAIDTLEMYGKTEMMPEKKPIVKTKKSSSQGTQAIEAVSEPVIETVTPVTAEHNVPSNTDKEDSEKKSARKNIADLIRVSKNDFKIGAFGGISNLQLKLTNNSPYPVDLVVVEVKYLLANKKEFKTENIYFKNLAPGATATKDAPKSPRGIDVHSKVALITSKALGMYQASL